MAVHLLEGLFFGIKNTQEAIGQRERLLALGALSAGLTHELNNPAAAAVRATAGLREKIVTLRHKLPAIAVGAVMTARSWRCSSSCSTTRPDGSPARPRWARWRPRTWRTRSPTGSTTTTSAQSWELAPPFVQAGHRPGQAGSDRRGGGGRRREQRSGAEGRADGELPGALRWLADTIETEQLLTEITDSVGRISSLVGAAKQYSQLDRAPYQVVDIHDLLDSTLAMLATKIGDGITVVRDYDRTCPGYPRSLAS